jgi:hypothetical protein
MAAPRKYPQLFDDWLAYHRVDGVDYWVQRSADYLVVLEA